MRIRHYNPFTPATSQEKTSLLSKYKFEVLNQVDYVLDKFEALNLKRPIVDDDENFNKGGPWANPDRLAYRKEFRVIRAKYLSLKEEFCWKVDSYPSMEGKEKKEFEKKVAFLEQLCSLIVFSLYRFPASENGLVAPVSEWAKKQIKEVEIDEEIIIIFNEDSETQPLP